jgi:predicted RNase H-like nuclease
LRKSLEQAGYPLLTNNMAPQGVIEVYPHPALVEIANAPIRLPYKASKMASYWPTITDPKRRRLQLYEQWSEIVVLLEDEIAGVREALPTLELSASQKELKAYEDKLDAIICAWVAICALEGRAIPYGDEDSAIWIPKVTGTR